MQQLPSKCTEWKWKVAENGKTQVKSKYLNTVLKNGTWLNALSYIRSLFKSEVEEKQWWILNENTGRIWYISQSIIVWSKGLSVDVIPAPPVWPPSSPPSPPEKMNQLTNTLRPFQSKWQLEFCDTVITAASCLFVFIIEQTMTNNYNWGYPKWC